MNSIPLINSLLSHFSILLKFSLFLYYLQVQAGRRTPKAAMKIAVDMVAQRSLTEREALLRIDAAKTNFFMQMQLRSDQLESAIPLGM